MQKNKYVTTTEAARILGISRVAVYKRIKKGSIKAIKIGKNFAIPREAIVFDAKGKPLTEEEKKIIEKSVSKTIKDYGDVLKRLGKE